MNKKRGSTFIETIVGVAIVSSMFLIATSFIVQNNRVMSRRKELEEANRIAFCIMQEIKYNLTIEEILTESQSGNFSFEKQHDFLESLSNNSILSIKKGNDIVIKLDKYFDKDKLNMYIEVYDQKKNLIVEKEFMKYRWMDYNEKS